MVMALLLLLPLSLPAAETTGTADLPSARPPLLNVIADAGRFSIFVDALKRTGVDKILDGEGPFTVFAPTDAAFAAMPRRQREVLFSPDHRAELKKMLRYHIVPGRIPADEVAFAERAPALIQQLEIKPAGGEQGRLRINEARTVGKALSASNGQFYGIDKVLIPHFHTLFLPDSASP